MLSSLSGGQHRFFLSSFFLCSGSLWNDKQTFTIWASKRETCLWGLRTTKAQTGQLLCYSLFEKYHITGFVASQPIYTCTVNSEIFARILFFVNSDKRHICDVKKFANRVWFNYISKWQSDCAKLRGLHFHETLLMRDFAKIKPARKFLNLQYIWVSQLLVIHFQ